MKLSDEIEAVAWAFAHSDTRHGEVRGLAAKVRWMENDLQERGAIHPEATVPAGPTEHETSLHEITEGLRRRVEALEQAVPPPVSPGVAPIYKQHAMRLSDLEDAAKVAVERVATLKRCLESVHKRVWELELLATEQRRKDG